ncbi:pancreatic secretory granule membrane major glycoprotein GP2-like isoform X2 [Alosa pseudoharengus]
MRPKETSFSMGGLLLLLLVLHTPQATSAQEGDPCYNYTVLNDPWRATTSLINITIRCDRNVQWQGWYRMVHQGVSVRMPETCVPKYRCGTHVPLWLNGAHPRPENGIVTREVCGHWDDSCCHFNCFLAYCAEPRTYFQQRLKLKMVLQREPSPAEIAQFSLQIREKLIQMGYPNDTTVKMV